MARRQRKSDFERTVEALARLPWPVCLALAPVAWFGFHLLAEIAPLAPRNVNDMSGAVGVAIFKAAGMFLQYIAPFALVLAAPLSWLGKRRRRKLLTETEKRTGSAPLQQLTWREFEQLVGGHFERQGYKVSFTPEGADGGVDIVARKASEIFLIQCKQWRATQVGVSIVRELFGVMAARGATGAFVVSIGPFTAEARVFAEGRNIELVDANTLVKPAPRKPPPSPRPATSCPRCGAAMVRRVAKRGTNSGQVFYGCSTYPKCRGTLPAD